MGKKAKKIKKKDLKCSICGSEMDFDCGGISGNFGICSVNFCEWCLSSLTDMFEQLNCEVCEGFKLKEKT